MVNPEGCEGVLKVFCHLGLCQDTSNDVYPLSVMRSCAAGYVNAGLEKNSWSTKVLKKKKVASEGWAWVEEVYSKRWQPVSMPEQLTHYLLDGLSVFWHSIAVFPFTKAQLEASEGAEWSNSQKMFTFPRLIMPPRRLAKKGWYHTHCSKTSRGKSLREIPWCQTASCLFLSNGRDEVKQDGK